MGSTMYSINSLCYSHHFNYGIQMDRLGLRCITILVLCIIQNFSYARRCQIRAKITLGPPLIVYVFQLFIADPYVKTDEHYPCLKRETERV